MKKICFISFGDITNAVNGYHVRCNVLVKKLVNEGNYVTVIQYAGHNAHEKYENYEIITIETEQEKGSPGNDLISKIIGFNPFSVLFFQYQAYKGLKKNTHHIANADKVYIEGCLLLAPFVLAKKFKSDITLDTHCINKDVALKIRKTSRLKGISRTIVWHQIEDYMCNKSNNIIVVSENDKNFVIEHFKVKPEKISVIPNAVSLPLLEQYTPEAQVIRKTLMEYNKEIKKIALFIGDLNAIHNKEAEIYIRDELAPHTKDVLYVLAGNNPNKKENTKNIVYTGFVDSVDPYIILADVCIAPLAIGSGTKTKVLDYIKYGKLILATAVAMEGIEATANVKQISLENFRNELKNFSSL